MKKTGKTAVGGVITALSVAAMFLTAILPFFTYVLPICAGMLMIIVNDELGRLWSLGVYFAVSALSLLVVADKEAALMYIAFFGYYPIIKGKIEHLNKVFAFVLKLLIFNSSVVFAYFLILKFFGFSGEEFNEFGKFTVPILLVLGNILFVLTDYILTLLTALYRKRFQSRLRKIFK